MEQSEEHDKEAATPPGRPRPMVIVVIRGGEAETYVFMPFDQPLVNAALAVVRAWETNKLAQSIQKLAAVLEEMGYETR